MKAISLFSGIGGFDLAFERAGIQTVAQVECDKNCLKLLADKFPHALRFDDVCTVGKHNLPEADVICGGFPCQDLSIAGKRAGLAGERSGLFFEFSRIVDERRPSYVIWENVPGLLNSDNGRDMLRVVSEFQRIGYCGAWRTLDAQHFGVAQRRRRVFGCFARRDIGAMRCAEVLSIAEGLRGHPTPCRDKGKRTTYDIAPCIGASGRGFERAGDTRGQDCVIPELARTLTARHDSSPCHDRGMNVIPELAGCLQEPNGGMYVRENPGIVSAITGAQSETFPVQQMAVRRLTPTECERLQGFPDGWTEGFSDSVRYQMLGNAVAVPVVEWIARRLINQWGATQ